MSERERGDKNNLIPKQLTDQTRQHLMYQGSPPGAGRAPGGGSGATKQRRSSYCLVLDANFNTDEEQDPARHHYDSFRTNVCEAFREFVVRLHNSPYIKHFIIPN